jgi:hypothetical protein
LSAEDANRQLTFQTQTFDALGLAVTRKVFVPTNAEFVRWLNIVTNTGTEPTRWDHVAGPARLRREHEDHRDLDRRLHHHVGRPVVDDRRGRRAGRTIVPASASGFAVQGPGATAPPRSVGIDATGRAFATYTPTIAPGASAIVMTFTTVQGTTSSRRARWRASSGCRPIRLPA